jgi:hypothetical protein
MERLVREPAELPPDNTQRKDGLKFSEASNPSMGLLRHSNIYKGKRCKVIPVLN